MAAFFPLSLNFLLSKKGGAIVNPVNYYFYTDQNGGIVFGWLIPGIGKKYTKGEKDSDIIQKAWNESFS